LVQFIKAEFGDHFCVGVGCYPEKHPDAPSAELDLKHFKAKVDAGADFAVTQFFFDADVYFLFVERCRNLGINIPIFPGVMPIQKYRLLQQMTEACKVQVPDQIRAQLEVMDDDYVTKFGIQTAVEMGKKLLAGGAPGLYLYTLNMEASATAVVTEMQLNVDAQLRNVYPFARSSPNGSPSRSRHPDCAMERSPAERFADRNLAERRDSRSPTSSSSRKNAWDEHSPDNGNRQEPDHKRLWMTLYAAPTRSRAELEALSASWTFQAPSDLERLFARFHDASDGTVQQLPWVSQPPGVESVTIKPDLVKLCKFGILPINAQARVNAALSSDPTVGWGDPDGIVFQKAYVELFCSPAHFGLLRRKFDEHRKVEWLAATRTGQLMSSKRKSKVTALTWGVFPGQPIQEPTSMDSDKFLVWRNKAFALWRLFPEATEASRAHLQEIMDSWYLVCVLDNDFLYSDLFPTLTQCFDE
jgi:methylenetetrahydrofolate reductase (NADPH)